MLVQIKLLYQIIIAEIGIFFFSAFVFVGEVIAEELFFGRMEPATWRKRKRLHFPVAVATVGISHSPFYAFWDRKPKKPTATKRKSVQRFIVKE